MALKNFAAFSIRKIHEGTIDKAENLDLVMPIYNLIEYSSDYSETTGSLRMKQLILIITLQTLINLNLSNIRLNFDKMQLHNPLEILRMEF